MVGRLHITLTYVASFLRLRRRARPGSPATRCSSEVAPITGPMYQLFIFFMITDPKTTVRTEMGAVRSSRSSSRSLEAVFRLMQFVYAPFYALFIVGPIANLIEMGLTKRATTNGAFTRRS